jgi:hypothetical protein
MWQAAGSQDSQCVQSSWMYRAAKENFGQLTGQEKYFEEMKNAYYNAIGEEDTFIVDLDYVLNIGLIHAATLTYSYELHEPAQTFVWDWICSGHADQTPLGRSYAPDSPYLGDTVMAAALAQMYSVKMQYWDGLKEGFKQGFQCFAEQQVRFRLPRPACPALSEGDVGAADCAPVGCAMGDPYDLRNCLFAGWLQRLVLGLHPRRAVIATGLADACGRAHGDRSLPLGSSCV